MNDPVLDVLRASHFLLRSGTGWTRHTLARDAAGEPVHYAKPEACQRCALGATGYVAARAQELDASDLYEFELDVAEVEDGTIADRYLTRAARDLYPSDAPDREYDYDDDGEPIREPVDEDHIANVNDGLGHADVLRMFEHAEVLRRADLAAGVIA